MMKDFQINDSQMSGIKCRVKVALEDVACSCEFFEETSCIRYSLNSTPIMLYHLLLWETTCLKLMKSNKQLSCSVYITYSEGVVPIRCPNSTRLDLSISIEIYNKPSFQNLTSKDERTCRIV